MAEPPAGTVDRTMKARRAGTCPRCRGAISVGQRIARVRVPPADVHGAPWEWVHVADLVTPRESLGRLLMSALRTYPRAGA